MHPQFVPMTKTGYQKIQQEIADLKKTRPSLIKALADARALGDLSENAEYSTAKRDLRRMEGRLRYLERQINYSKIVENADRSKIDLGSNVTLRFLDDDFTVTYEIVGKHEADVAQQKVSYQSPLGAALLHHHLHDVVTVNAPDEQYQVEILAIN
ncbi:transcription elongation factor GreA [Pediococcus acidilactici]|uniref:transcription elongation factor GreA n=1 Tax=Pediococcus acidilactici TaxID=1254 RepID=UPI000326F745|nr:transcription elongation factor GreA [Pediococcus acidilactici]EOA08924.1 transcription elongation factor GreA, greA [Pediococcus acidilactici D3]MBW4797187.1 transcription elongation factor GreA [Pediococcus acidilactici]MBW9306851.1 transcription elongation factor GreA [Pediococcus acidilactici]MCE5962306.1 transcription elongation factor GreA [Pediococcus acidilactici]MDB8857530.1 transcription elongation factor GreA [Pediococcus acidilactici]